ncbi:hypothetical protein N182_18485 [Sinorhizobium sp. GL2]|nr:hypothetical protein N182_18485 [Sinorhizobium sp. GL2]
MSRWIRVQTSIFDHEVFAAEPFSEREAWLWLISKAAWKGTVHRVGATVLPVPAGSLFVTIREMQTAWKWTSTRRVHQFLCLLSSQNMIETRSETGKTHVTICNYSKYQNSETHSETSTHSGPKQDRNTKDTSTPDTNKSSLRSDKHRARADEARTPRSELEIVLDPEHVTAVLDHRQRIRKPLTAHAAKLLAGKFSRCPDPNAAADAMVSNGWQGFEPEWMENRAGSNHQPRSPPPHRERSILDVIDERLEQQNAELTFDTGRTIEHEPGGSASPVVRFPADAARYRR